MTGAGDGEDAAGDAVAGAGGASAAARSWSSSRRRGAMAFAMVAHALCTHACKGSAGSAMTTALLRSMIVCDVDDEQEDDV